MLASEITLESMPETEVAMACIFVAEFVPLAPSVPSVTALFSDVVMELIAEAAVCIWEVTEVTFLVYWSTLAE